MKRIAAFTIAIAVMFAWLVVAQTSRADATTLETTSIVQGPIVQTQPGHRLKSLSLSQTSVIGGTNFTGRVTLQFLAPTGGTTVHLTTDPLPGVEGENFAFVPSTVHIPKGQATATFEIKTNPVETQREIKVIAKAGGVTRTVSFTLRPRLRR
jgi:hypothetical protein